MSKLEEICKEIKRLENDLKTSNDYNEQWKIGMKLRKLYKEEFKLKMREGRRV